MTGEVFFGIPFAAVGFLEVVEFVVELHIVVDRLGTVLVAQLRVFTKSSFVSLCVVQLMFCIHISIKDNKVKI